MQNGCIDWKFKMSCNESMLTSKTHQELGMICSYWSIQIENGSKLCLWHMTRLDWMYGTSHCLVLFPHYVLSQFTPTLPVMTPFFNGILCSCAYQMRFNIMGFLLYWAKSIKIDYWVNERQLKVSICWRFLFPYLILSTWKEKQMSVPSWSIL